MALFTAENAAEMAKRSHAPGSARNKPKPEAQPEPVLSPVQSQAAPVPAEPGDQFSRTLDSACDQVLTRLMKTKKPIEQAQLARCLRDLRETYHLATGKPKPGMLKPGSAVERRPPMPRVYPGVYPQNHSDVNNGQSTG